MQSARSFWNSARAVRDRGRSGPAACERDAPLTTGLVGEYCAARLYGAAERDKEQDTARARPAIASCTCDHGAVERLCRRQRPASKAIAPEGSNANARRSLSAALAPTLDSSPLSHVHFPSRQSAMADDGASLQSSRRILPFVFLEIQSLSSVAFFSLSPFSLLFFSLCPVFPCLSLCPQVLKAAASPATGCASAARTTFLTARRVLGATWSSLAARDCSSISSRAETPRFVKATGTAPAVRTITRGTDCGCCDEPAMCIESVHVKELGVAACLHVYSSSCVAVLIALCFSLCFGTFSQPGGLL
jgi:hypothetical protein